MKRAVRIQFVASNAYRFSLWIFYRALYYLKLDRFVPRCLEPWYVTAVSSDGDVLCHCTAALKPFVLGSLYDQSMKDIWEGDSYQQLRKNICNGKLPHYRCVGCARLSKRHLSRIKETLLRKIYLEPTALCNLKCISCQNQNVLNKRKAFRLDLGLVDRLTKDIKDTIKTVYPFFDGEIFANSQSYEMLKLIRKNLPNAFILLHTNGILLDSPQKRQDVIDTVDHVIFSIDGATNESYLKYRRGGNFEGATGNMSELIAERDSRNKVAPRVDWKYLIFKWNSSREEIEAAERMAIEIGVDRLFFVPTIRPFWGMSLYHVLLNRSIISKEIGRIYTDRSIVKQKEVRQ